jgi:4-oxalocrotonate tautomerase
MPLVRIDVPSGKPSDFNRAIADVVYEIMLTALNAPAHDRFQVLCEHDSGSLIIDPSYLNIERGPDAIIIQVTLNEGRTLDQKKAFYKGVADGLHERLGMRREDVMISLVEVKKENWSFGNGIAQYA